MASNGYKPSCGDCPYWERVTTGQAAGKCRRNPPVLVPLGTVPPAFQGAMPRLISDTYFIMTPDTEWCGEHPRMKFFINAPISQLELTQEQIELAGKEPEGTG